MKDLESRSYSAGVVHHDSIGDLERCLLSLQAQSATPRRITVIDHGRRPEELERLRNRFRDVRFRTTTNEGYSGGANRIVRDAEEHRDDFVLILNPDVVLDPDFARILVDAMSARPQVVVASGKLLRPDRTTIDSAGISMGRDRRPRDRGSERSDLGHYDQTESVFAVCGAAMLLRTDAATKIAIAGEVFDNDFFCYYEDTDLCWRAALLGYEILYEPRARALHVRGWQREHRFRVPVEMRRHSFKNRYLQLLKNERVSDFLVNLPLFLAWEVLRFGFVILRDRDLLASYGEALRLTPRILEKRQALRGMVERGASRTLDP